jgi:hypothetical protein
LANFEKTLLDRIEEIKSRINKAHSSINNEILMIKIEALNGFYLKDLD